VGRDRATAGEAVTAGEEVPGEAGEAPPASLRKGTAGACTGEDWTGAGEDWAGAGEAAGDEVAAALPNLAATAGAAEGVDADVATTAGEAVLVGSGAGAGLATGFGVGARGSSGRVLRQSNSRGPVYVCVCGGWGVGGGGGGGGWEEEKQEETLKIPAQHNHPA
jgi:hypothetical protein